MRRISLLPTAVMAALFGLAVLVPRGWAQAADGGPNAVAPGETAAGEAVAGEAGADEVPLVQIYRVFFDDFPIPDSYRNPVAPPLGRRNLEFHFGVTGLAPADSVRLQYQMSGLDAAWVDADGRRRAEYRGLRPGSYTFRVRAEEVDGRWQDSHALPVTIEPHFYETWWALLIAALAVLFVLSAVFRFKTRRVRTHARELTDLVGKRTAALQTEKERAEGAREEAEQARIEAERAREEAERERENTVHALQTIEEMAVQLLRMDHMKSRLFANLSHGFRTPLTLIIDPLERAVKGELGDLDGYARHTLDLARLNAERLLRLVNQLLDLSKLEAGHMELRAEEHDLVPFLEQVVDLFSGEADRLDITLLFRTEAERIAAHFDREKLEKVVCNLVSNALKATPEGGKILVKVRAVAGASDAGAPGGGTPGHAEITVRDTGAGISAAELPFVFDRFYQAEAGKLLGGTGIGLSLAKEFTELHHGEIAVESQPGFGSAFTVYLPLGDAHLAEGAPLRLPGASENGASENGASENGTPDYGTPENGAPENGTPENGTPEADAPPPSPPPGSAFALDVESPRLPPRPRPLRALADAGGDGVADGPARGDDAPAPPPDSPLVLVVDDNEDILRLIRSHLGARYRLLEARDGRAALDLLRAERPDIVVSDVLMPVMDGLSMCRRIREDPDLASTPVILLTARAGDDSRLAGLDTGADDYMTKPFLGEELTARVGNLLRRQRQLRERFSDEVLLQPLGLRVRSADAALVERAFAVIAAHLDEVDFTVADFAEELGISQAQLKRKLRAIADQSPLELIRTYRLERAYELLERQAGNVGEVAFQVGFGSASYFSKVFREHFDVLPSEVLAGTAPPRHPPPQPGAPNGNAPNGNASDSTPSDPDASDDGTPSDPDASDDGTPPDPDASDPDAP